MSNTEFFGLSDHYTPHEEPARSRLTSRRQLHGDLKKRNKTPCIKIGDSTFF